MLVRNLLRVDLTTGKVQKEIVGDKEAQMLIGGRALGAMLLYNELDPGIDALDLETSSFFPLDH